MKEFIIDNVVFMRGENAIENWQMLETEDPEHFFFHLSSFPSCYVSMRYATSTKELLIIGSNICKDGTKFKNISNLKVDICKFSNLRKGSKVGEVIYRSNRQIIKLMV